MAITSVLNTNTSVLHHQTCIYQSLGVSFPSNQLGTRLVTQESGEICLVPKTLGEVIGERILKPLIEKAGRASTALFSPISKAGCSLLSLAESFSIFPPMAQAQTISSPKDDILVFGKNYFSQSTYQSSEEEICYLDNHITDGTSEISLNTIQQAISAVKKTEKRRDLVPFKDFSSSPFLLIEELFRQVLDNCDSINWRNMSPYLSLFNNITNVQGHSLLLEPIAEILCMAIKEDQSGVVDYLFNNHSNGLHESLWQKNPDGSRSFDCIYQLGNRRIYLRLLTNELNVGFSLVFDYLKWGFAFFFLFNCFKALVKTRKPEVYVLIVVLKTFKDHKLRIKAVKALGRIGPPAAEAESVLRDILVEGLNPDFSRRGIRRYVPFLRRDIIDITRDIIDGVREGGVGWLTRAVQTIPEYLELQREVNIALTKISRGQYRGVINGVLE
ncbi:MAG: hypothetical protein HYZ54_03715 [Ignavibacteriae bacterium]|nr:hypothetical protein [Ignavibacteriota bacterium]